MIAALLADLWPYIAGLLGIIAGALGLYAKGRSDAKAKAETATLRDTAKREDAGREAVAKEKRATDGATDRDIVDSLRRRDGDWGGM